MRIYKKQTHPLVLLVEINARNLLYLLTVLLALVAVIATTRNCSGREEDETVEEVEESGEDTAEETSTGNLVEYYGKKLNYRSVFKDVNELHLQAADSVGIHIRPASREDIEHNIKSLVKIATNKYYKLDSLTHSAPYLTRNSASMLMEIARAFRDSLEVHDFPEYRIVVTSVLRTEEDVRKLTRRNGNATKDSAHCYGTTFDISYVSYDKVVEGGDYMEAYSLTKLLSEVLRDFRDAGDIYVKYEVKQPCFHISSRR